MAQTENEAQSRPEPAGRRPFRLSLRVAAIGALVMLLAALPVLPLRSLGIPGPDWSRNSRVPGIRAWLGRMFGSAGSPADGARQSTTRQAGRCDRLAALEAAAGELKLQISASPHDPALENRLGALFLAAGEIDGAQEHFQKAKDLAAAGLANLAVKDRRLADSSEAREPVNVALEAARLNVELTAAHSNLARVFEMLGHHDRVLAELDAINSQAFFPGLDEGAAGRAAGAEAGSQRGRTAAVSRLIGQGQALAAQSRHKEAIHALRQALALAPADSLCHHHLGLSHTALGEHEAAVEELEAAAHLDPTDAVAANNLGLLYELTGKTESAIAQYHRAMALEPKMAQPGINLGNLYSARGDFTRARRVLEAVVRNNPGSAVAHNNLGATLSMQGEYGPAIKEFSQAAALQPQMSSAHCGLGLALYETRNYRQAVRALKRALILDPGLIAAQHKLERAQRELARGEGSAFGFN